MRSGKRTSAGAKPAKKTAAPASGPQREVFDKLREILRAYESDYAVTVDTATDYSMETRGAAFRGKPVCFAAVKMLTSKVGVYVMGVYASSEIQAMVTPELKRLQTGKCCFNFSSADEALFRRLAEIIARCHSGYRKLGWV